MDRLMKPSRITHYTPVTETDSLYGGVYALDENGVLWFSEMRLMPDNSKGFIHWLPLNLPEA